jgi:hypothetical protein
MWNVVDPLLEAVYGLTGLPRVDFLLGTFILALAATVVGEFTISIVFRFNRRHIDELTGRLRRLNRLCEEALERGDQETYRLLNKEANDAHGREFFSRFGLSAAALWPVFFALEGVQRVHLESSIPIPLTPWSANYLVVFIVCYILARIVFGRLKRHLPYFRKQYAMLRSYDTSDGKGP